MVPTSSLRIDPDTGRIVVIEMNPRVSRSSASGLQSDRVSYRQGRRQARGRLYPRRARSTTSPGVTPASFEPASIMWSPRCHALPLRKFSQARSTSDHADEVCWRGHGDWSDFPGVAAERRCGGWRRTRIGLDPDYADLDRDWTARSDILKRRELSNAGCRANVVRSPMHFANGHVGRREIFELTSYRSLVLAEIEDLRLLEWSKRWREPSLRKRLSGIDWYRLKQKGFSDARLAQLLTRAWRNRVRSLRQELDMRPMLSAGGYLCRRVCGDHTPTCTRPMRTSAKRNPSDAAKGHGAGWRAQPDRPGHRVRLLLRARLRWPCARMAMRPSW